MGYCSPARQSIVTGKQRLSIFFDQFMVQNSVNQSLLCYGLSNSSICMSISFQLFFFSIKEGEGQNTRP